MMKQKKFYDLAAEQFQTAKSEIPGLSEEKKEVLYELGSCYELQGDLDNAMGEFKALYGADIGFRDVAQKIDDFYSRRYSDKSGINKKGRKNESWCSRGGLLERPLPGLQFSFFLLWF